MKVKIKSYDTNCEQIGTTIDGIAHNAPVPSFPTGSRFEISVKKPDLISLQPNVCLFFENENASVNFPNGISIQVYPKPEPVNSPVENWYDAEVLFHGCSCEEH